MNRTINFLLENSLFLIFGALGGLIWANLDTEAYHNFLHAGFDSSVFYDHGLHHQDPTRHVFTVHFFVNDILMALFFAIAGKEVWEATFPGGPLSNIKRAATPLIATIGGMAGPAIIYVAGAAMTGRLDELGHGWAIPTATDIAFSYLVARIVFGGGHPAIPFLLLLAIADDALGLIIIAVFYPSGAVKPAFLLLCVAGMLICYIMKRMRKHSFWPYIIVGGTLSWLGFYFAGLHPALGLLPIIPVLPHAHTDPGLFNWLELKRHDTLNEFEHTMKNPVEIVLGLFGLMNAGVVFSAVGEPTWLVLFGLLLGKPIGIFLMGLLAARGLKCGLPDGMNLRDLFTLGCAAAIGFTVALFVSSVAFKPGDIQDAAKMGALASFFAAVVTLIVGRVLGVVRVPAADKDVAETT